MEHDNLLSRKKLRILEIPVPVASLNLDLSIEAILTPEERTERSRALGALAMARRIAPPDDIIVG